MKTTIFQLDNWREISHTLARNKTRTFLTAFGIFWGTAILALCWGGGRGFQGIMRRQFQGLATNMAVVSAGATSIPYNGYNKGRTWSITDRDIESLRRSITDFKDFTSVIQTYSSSVKSTTASTSASCSGVQPDFWKIQTLKLLEGRLTNQADGERLRKCAVIGKDIAASLFGNGSAVGQMISVDGVYYKVIGVVEQLSEANIGGEPDRTIFVPSAVLKRTYNIGDSNGYLIFTTRRGVKPGDVENHIRHILYKSHSIAPDDPKAMQFSDISEMFEMVDNIFSGVDLLTLFVGIGTLLAGVIGVGNIMWIIVKERTQEIGIRRAIGATPSDIITQILSESIVLTTIAGLAGICFSAFVLGAIDHAQYDPWLGAPGFELTFTHAVVIFISFLILGTAAGSIPAFRAMRIKPVEAINDR